MDPCIESKRPRQQKMVNGVRKRLYQWAAEEKYGPIPAGMQVNHLCDNPYCYNADHLYYGDPQENMNDQFKRGRTVRDRDHRYIAHHSPQAKTQPNLETKNADHRDSDMEEEEDVEGCR